jgi:hypothetical protein
MTVEIRNLFNTRGYSRMATNSRVGFCMRYAVSERHTDCLDSETEHFKCNSCSTSERFTIKINRIELILISCKYFNLPKLGNHLFLIWIEQRFTIFSVFNTHIS